LDRATQLGEADHLLDMAGQQQLLHHVENQKRLHAVERNAVPQLRAGDDQEPPRVPEDLLGPQLLSLGHAAHPIKHPDVPPEH
jgi:hypothetical protein